MFKARNYGLGQNTTYMFKVLIFFLIQLQTAFLFIIYLVLVLEKKRKEITSLNTV